MNENKTFTGIQAEIPVQSGDRSVKVVIDSPTLKVLEMSFDKGAGLPSHTSDKSVVVTCLSGSIEFVVEGKAQVLAAGDMVYMVPNAEHSCTALEPSYMSVVQAQLA